MSSWNDSTEDLMKAWGEKSAGLRWIHAFESRRWNAFANKLSMGGIILTTLTSTASLATAGFEDSATVMYAVGAVGMISSILQAAKKFYSADERAVNHASIAKQFGSFYRLVSLQMGIARDERRPADTFAEWALTEYERLQKEAPNVTSTAIDIYKSAFPNAEHVPDIAEDDFTITIHGRTIS